MSGFEKVLRGLGFRVLYRSRKRLYGGLSTVFAAGV